MRVYAIPDTHNREIAIFERVIVARTVPPLFAFELRAVGGEMTKTTTGFTFLPLGWTLLSVSKGMRVMSARFARQGNAGGFVDWRC